MEEIRRPEYVNVLMNRYTSRARSRTEGPLAIVSTPLILPTISGSVNLTGLAEEIS